MIFTAATAPRPQPAARPAAGVCASHIHRPRLWAVTAYTPFHRKEPQKRAYVVVLCGKVLCIVTSVWANCADAAGTGGEQEMTKYEKISVLARETAKRISANREEWIRYLDVASRLYKYPFEDQLLI